MDANKRNEFNAAFGAFLKEARLKRELYQRDVAQHIGVTQSYYALIESGSRNVDLQVALELCKFLGLDLNDFIKTQK